MEPLLIRVKCELQGIANATTAQMILVYVLELLYFQPLHGKGTIKWLALPAIEIEETSISLQSGLLPRHDY